MSKELDLSMLDDVTGGTVIISKDAMIIGFSTTRERFSLQNCTFREARDFRDDLLEQNPNMNNAQFDAFCKEQFHQRGWIQY